MASSGIGIQRTVTVGEPPQEARERFMGYFTTWMAQGGYGVKWQTPESVTYAKRSFHTWQIVVAILIFPLGLLALLAEKQEHQMIASFRASGEKSTSIMITGLVPGKVSGQLADRIDEFDPSVP